MAARKLSAKFLLAVKPPSSGRQEYWDVQAPGLGLRVTSAGAKSWVLMYRVRGLRRLRRMTIGTYPAFSLAQARERADEARKLAGRGIDPIDQRRSDRMDQATRSHETVEVVFKRFLLQHAKANTRKTTWAETERIFEANILPAWRHRPVTRVTRRDVHEIVDAIAARNAPYMANRTLAAIRKFFNWCVQKDLATSSPATQVKPVAREQSRDRVLADSEIKALWTACEVKGWPFGTAVQVMLLTGQRRNEVRTMQWSDIDLDQKRWTLPREKTKGDRSHIVPLGPLALEMLRSVKKTSKPADYVFTTTGDTAVSGFSKAKKKLDEDSLLQGWRLHDLRRTVASKMAGIGIAPHVVEKVLNHTSGEISGVAAIYNRHGYEDEKLTALEAWENKLEQILERKSRKNIVPISEARRS
jgi:integrase